MQDKPSTETVATPEMPSGNDVKALVTPGDDAGAEAEAEKVAAPNVGGDDKASQADAQPGDIEELDEDRAENGDADDKEDRGSFSGRSDD